MTNYQKRKEKNDEYRSKIMRFTFQLSLGDGEVRDWFEQQPEKGAYLKDLILRDKAERLGYREQKSAEPDKAGDYEIIQSIRMGGRVLLMGFNPKDETYMTCYQQYNFLGETMYPEALACKSYLEIAETFLNRLQAQVEKVKAFRAARNVPYAVLGAEACLPSIRGISARQADRSPPHQPCTGIPHGRLSTRLCAGRLWLYTRRTWACSLLRGIVFR
ncbi:MAG: hypothetical protein ACLUEU_06535 [Oscillospiraceae bacterium]